MPDELRDALVQVLDAEVLQGEGLLEVLAVVELEVLLGEARAVRVVQVLLEGMKQQVQLEARAEQRPVLVYTYIYIYI